jgi:hypothetical protein
MSKSIAPGKEVFQFGVRHKPTGRWLKKTPGYSFYLTDIPSVYNSAKVAQKSVDNESKYNHLCKPGDTEIVKFRLFMEEVKEPTQQEIDYAKELKDLQTAHKIIGELEWTEVKGERGRWEIYSFVKHLDILPMKKGDSLHCSSERYQTSQGIFEFTWIDNKMSEMPDLIMRGNPIDWERKYDDLKKKHGIS